MMVYRMFCQCQSQKSLYVGSFQLWKFDSIFFLAQTHLLCAPSTHQSSCTNWLTFVFEMRIEHNIYVTNKSTANRMDQRNVPSIFINWIVEEVINLIAKWFSYIYCLLFGRYGKSWIESIDIIRNSNAFELHAFSIRLVGSKFPLLLNLFRHDKFDLAKCTAAKNQQKSEQLTKIKQTFWILSLVCFDFNKLLH